uniref:Uncharacterized protein n=1 Tax=Propithecus coquereli TaxID=379532 RepID=A0A2K6FYT2_PROCO
VRPAAAWSLRSRRRSRRSRRPRGRGRCRPARRAGPRRRRRRPRAPGAARSARCRCGRSHAGRACPPREHGRREGGRVVVDVEHDDPTLKQVHPALRGPDHRHLEVQEALVLVEDHLTLGQLLAVDAPLARAQLAGEVVDLQVLGARLQAESHLTRASHDAQVRRDVADADVGGALLGQPVSEELLGGRQAERERQKEAAAQAPAARPSRGPHPQHLLLLLLLLLLLTTAPSAPPPAGLAACPPPSPIPSTGKEGEEGEGGGKSSVQTRPEVVVGDQR